MTTRIGWVGLGCFALLACGTPTPVDVCKGRLVGDLVVTEIMLDPEGTDTGGEWFEIYNTLGTDIDLKGMTIFTRDTDGSGAKSHVVKAGTVKAQSYFTLGDIRAGALPTWIGYTYADDLGSFGNSRGIVGIKCGTTIFDEVTWTKAAKPNRSRMLDPVAPKTSTANDDETKWCDTQVGTVYTGTSAGTPGAANVACMAEAMLGTCVENNVARPINAPTAGDLIITEVMANPKLASSATTGAWFEVLATKAVDLNDLTVATPTSDTDIKNTNCITVVPGEYVLFARSSDTFINGSLPTPRVNYSLSITTGNNRLYLRRGDAGIDEAAFTTAPTGTSVQLDALKIDAVSNDDPANFCRSTIRFDGGTDAGLTDFGSPGAANEMCPFTDGGTGNDGGTDAGPTDAGDPTQCYDPGTAAFRPIVKAATGDLVVTEFMANPAAVGDTVGEWFEVLVKADADLNGLLMSGNSGLNAVNSANCLRYDAGTLVLFANNADPATNGNIAPLAGTFSFSLVNTTGKIVLFTDAGMVDQVTWTAVADGKSKQLDVTKQDAVQNDNAANFCDGDGGIVLFDGGNGDKGSPGTANHACP
jgi:hypothetical protein